MNTFLPLWNTLLVHPLMHGLEFVATPLLGILPAGVAGALAIVIFTLLLRLILVPLSLVQIRSQRAQMAIQPELKAIQRKFKGDREGLARAQMALYKERGINPAAGCFPLLIQMPILFGMYAAMSQLATTGLTLDQVLVNQVTPGTVTYSATRTVEPLPYNQFVLADIVVVPHGTDPITISIDPDRSSVSFEGNQLPLSKEDLTITPGSVPAQANQNPPNSQQGTAGLFLRSGVPDPDGITMDREVPVPNDGSPYTIEVWANAASTNVDTATAVVTYDPTRLDVTQVETPKLNDADLAFKSRFLWLPSLSQPDTFQHPFGLSFNVPGLLLLIMTISSFISQRMTTMPTEDPQQQAMMRSMAFMPLMYLFFFLNTPAGLVLYWLTSNVFSMFQQYFTVGLGLLGGDLLRITGRDFQPPWGHTRGQTAPVAALAVADSGNGRADGYSNVNQDQNTPAPGERRVAGATRRPRPGSQGKGRKRGKR